MAEVISKTGATEGGEQLWCIHYMSSKYDSDSRMSGTSQVDSRAFVLARSYEEAMEKAKPQIEEARKRADKGAKEKIETTIVTIESLVAARDSSSDGRLGAFSTQMLSAVKLSNPDDAKRYRLGVCLIPIE